MRRIFMQNTQRIFNFINTQVLYIFQDNLETFDI